jgi:hypothetical protein
LRFSLASARLMKLCVLLLALLTRGAGSHVGRPEEMTTRPPLARGDLKQPRKLLLRQLLRPYTSLTSSSIARHATPRGRPMTPSPHPYHALPLTLMCYHLFATTRPRKLGYRARRPEGSVDVQADVRVRAPRVMRLPSLRSRDPCRGVCDRVRTAFYVCTRCTMYYTLKPPERDSPVL